MVTKNPERNHIFASKIYITKSTAFLNFVTYITKNLVDSMACELLVHHGVAIQYHCINFT